MVQVLEEVPSFGQMLGRGLGAGISKGLSSTLNFAQQMALQRQKSATLGQQTKQLEKIKMMETGLGTIERMRELLPFAGGWTSDPLMKLKSLVPGETQKGRAELESLGRSLIPIVAAGVPIRNQREFDEYRKVITDPSSSASQLEGALNGIQDILQRSMESPEKEEEPQKSHKRQKFSSSNPEHTKVRDALMKKFQGDREKVKSELDKFFEE